MLLCCWSSTAPNRNADASAETFVSVVGSYKANVVGFDHSCFTFRNAVDWTGPDLQDLDLLRSSRSDSVISAMWGVNFPCWLAIPRNLLSSGTLVGRLISTIVLSSLGLLSYCVHQSHGQGK